MIANKLLPGFYLIEVEGTAVKSIIDGEFGIKRIVLGSNDFDSDLSATEAMQHSIDYITSSTVVNWDETDESVVFNPEFFPTIESEHSIETCRKNEEEKLIREFEEQENVPEGKIAINITKHFDPAGDYIQSRWTLDNPQFKINGKIGVNPQLYLQHKISEATTYNSNPLSNATDRNITVH